MTINTKNMLRDIGLQLDSNTYPRIYNGGVVQPGDTSIVLATPGEDSNYVKQKQRRSEAKQRNGATRRQRSSGGSWEACSAAPLFYASFCETYEAEIEEVSRAYPGTEVWQQTEGLWLLTESTVLPGLGKKATFLTAIPYLNGATQKSWGFWTTAISNEWIGPRHTNFPDGSICAFEPKDKTWSLGDSIVSLLDIYTLWALRHEHLKVFDRWPGFQSVSSPYERLIELKDNEFCGCSHSENRYKDCCKKHDLSIPLYKSFFDFMLQTRGNVQRKPPEEILEFMKFRTTPPPINKFCLT